MAERKPAFARGASNSPRGTDSSLRSRLASERDEIISLVKRKSYYAAESLLVSQCQAGVFEVMLWNRLTSELKRGDGSWEDILRLLRRMEHLGCPPDVVSFNILIDSCGKAGQLEHALSFFNEMRGRGLRPTVNTFTSIIDASGKLG